MIVTNKVPTLPFDISLNAMRNPACAENEEATLFDLMYNRSKTP